ncbi:hypothetical protein EV659_101465 [Rhodothalassium salexigens DSM 2132]|uniref:Uncharacterized protein n=1 Tax=Rhodothalassium salexigens DSM 2132 TaxID=1188247 RepID=A0A4R2PU40_RHOSA|nr:hypothetical protein [Rhodothalassium salexigens]MBB4210394.1 hypothetical protein [Rhodothalassium salexigens DSM 2132]MBK1638595.1 hypothetical protein [Rhodothalassium salexigens DSM 2132]TCP38558.1 hypothetical protein EV659_101465 [Rhodothalassium salexigens DSM 2132]
MSLKTEAVALVKAGLTEVRSNVEVVLLSAGLVVIAQLVAASLLVLLFADVQMDRVAEAVATLQSQMQVAEPDAGAMQAALGALLPLVAAGILSYLVAFPLFPVVWSRVVIKGRAGARQMDQGEGWLGLYAGALGRVLIGLVPFVLLLIIALIGVLMLSGLVGPVFMLLGLGSAGGFILQLLQSVVLAAVFSLFYAGLGLSLAGASVRQGPGVFGALRHVVDHDRRLLVAVVIVSVAVTLANQVAVLAGALLPLAAVLLYLAFWVVSTALNLAVCALAWRDEAERDTAAF